VDIWNKVDPTSASFQFLRRLLAWCRHRTEQAWIGVYEPHTDPVVQASFAIDTESSALSTPWRYGVTGGTTPNMRPLSSELWQQAFAAAMRGESPPTYWSLFHDASIHRAEYRSDLAVLAFALSLEVARDTLFEKFAPTKVRQGLGTVLAGPFQGTDVKAHLSHVLDKVRKRSLEREEPQTWLLIDQLWVARHHVAHGRPPVYQTSKGLKRVGDDDLGRWYAAVRNTLQWMENL